MKTVKLDEPHNVSYNVYHCYDMNGDETSAQNCTYLLANSPEAVEEFIDDCNGEYCRGLYKYTPSNTRILKQRLFCFDEAHNTWREIPDGLIQVIKKRMTRG